jgi:ATP-binding protein involved in chromosome partitioning
MDLRHEPQTIDVQRTEAVIVTFRDDYEARFDLVELRQGCPCAACRGLRDRGEQAWPLADSPLPLEVRDARLHGAWGLAIEWNDGHATGIYPFEALRRWAEEGITLTPDSGFG